MVSDLTGNADPLAPSWYSDEIGRKMAAGDPEAALAICEEGLGHWPDTGTLWARKLSILMLLGRDKQAAEIVADTNGLAHSAAGLPVFQMRAFEFLLARNDISGAKARLDVLADIAPGSVAHLTAAGKYGMATKEHADAVKVLEPAIGQFPNDAQLLRSLAQNLAASGQAARALDQLVAGLQRAFDPGLVLTLVRLLAGQACTDAARDVLDRYRTEIPRFPHVALEYVQLKLEQQDFGAAVEIAEAALGTAPDDLKLHQLRWDSLTGAGRIEEAVTFAVFQAGDAATGAPGAIAAARFLFRSGYSDQAFGLLHDALRRYPDSAQVLQAAASAHLVHGSDATTALALADDGIARGLTLPALSRIRATAQRRLGYLPAAIRTLQEARDRGDLDVAGHLDLADYLIESGHCAEASDLLHSAQSMTPAETPRMYVLQSDIALQRSDFAGARDHLTRALALRPDDALVLRKLARLTMLAGDYATAWEHYRTGVRSAQGLEKLRRTLLGQILNEFRIFFGAQDALGPRWDGDTNGAARRFYRDAIAADPGNTPAAIALMATLRRGGGIAAQAPDMSTVPPGDAIPQTIWQYWDTPDLPAQIAALMDWNKARNTGYAFRLFDCKSAAHYINNAGERDVLAAFRLAPNAAAQSDLLRLVILWHEGGIWLDTDDRCLGPLSDLVDHRLRMVGYQEHLRSIGSNFLAVRPHDPIIRAALDDAAQAMRSAPGASVWLSTGPGAITRAMALQGTDVDGHLLPGIRIIPDHMLNRSLVPHVRLSYKSTASHWVSQMRNAEAV